MTSLDLFCTIVDQPESEIGGKRDCHPKFFYPIDPDQGLLQDHLGWSVDLLATGEYISKMKINDPGNVVQRHPIQGDILVGESVHLHRTCGPMD